MEPPDWYKKSGFNFSLPPDDKLEVGPYGSGGGV